MVPVPVERALIGAFTSKGRLSHIVRVIVLDAKDWNDHRPNRDWDACDLTHGACFTDWMKGDRTMTHEWVFSEFAVAHGFADSSVMERALAEFGKISECGWARAMIPSEIAPKPAWKLAD